MVIRISTVNKLYVDFDNTIVNTTKSIVDLYNEDYMYYDKYKYVDWTDIKTWGFQELTLLKKGKIYEYFNQPRLFKNVQFFDNAKRSLDWLSNFYEIYIVSAGHTPNLKQKEIWLKENLPYTKFIGVNNEIYDDKSHVDMSDGFFIDDVSKNLITSNAYHGICFGNEYSWNDDWTGTRCQTWIEVNRFLMASLLQEEV